jgi:malate dehydrogenase
MAYAGARFTSSLLKAMSGQAGVSECAFVESSVTDSPYFATRITLGAEGITDIAGLGELSDFEAAGLKEAVPQLIASYEKGVKFVKGK